MAPASKRHKNDLIQRQRNPVGSDVMFDVVRDTPAEGLNCEAEQPPPDRNTVSSRRVSIPLKDKRALDMNWGTQATNRNVHEVGKTDRRTE